MGISEGLIAPLTYSEPDQSNIYVYNGIFISRAEDTKDVFKLCEGEEAARKATSRDMNSQKLVKALEVEGLGTVLCTIIDYKGVRYVAQSIIPGIFQQGENSAQLMYGVLEPNKNITVSHCLSHFSYFVCVVVIPHGFK
jgi:protein TIF31